MPTKKKAAEEAEETKKSVEAEEEVATPPKPRGRGEEVDTPPKSAVSTKEFPREVDLTPRHTPETLKMKEKLDESPRVNFYVPLNPKEDPKSLETVTINGYKMGIPKGKMVSLPFQAAEILANMYNVEMTAGEHMRIDRSEKVEKALS